MKSLTGTPCVLCTDRGTDNTRLAFIQPHSWDVIILLVVTVFVTGNQFQTFTYILIPVWSQFRIINSRGISSISTVATTSSKNSFFTQSKSAMAYLLFVVVAFLWKKFIRCSTEYAQCRLSSTCPLNSTNMDLSQVKTIPLAAAIAIHADTTPPPSLTFFKYNCTFRSKSSPNRTRLPR